MEQFDHKNYRRNLAKDITDIHKEDPETAKVVSDAHKNTENYQKAKELHEADRERLFLDNLNSLIRIAKNYSGTYNLNIPIMLSMGHKVDIKMEKILNDTKDIRYITGLTFEPVETTQGIVTFPDNSDAKDLQGVIANGERSNLHEIRLNVNDIKRFNKSLKLFNENNLKSEDVESLKFVAQSLIKQIKEQYDLESGTEDRLLNLFLGMEEFIENYKRLGSKNEEGRENGLADSVKQFEAYLEASRAGYMREYILAENNELIPTEIGSEIKWDGYGNRIRTHGSGDTPSTWQQGIQNLNGSRYHGAEKGPDPYEERDRYATYRYLHEFRDKWNKAFETLDILDKKPETKKFYTEIKEYIRKSLKYVGEYGVTSTWDPESIKELEKKSPIIAEEMKRIRGEIENH